ncbi:MAG: 4a-hydroxytetrahydrobiopterin dehydratase, partial [Acidobacteria bacterium]|nr:4a-hydroxytetrahydrobiopterin dehydratase [Acidobacteriota bacterium]
MKKEDTRGYAPDSRAVIMLVQEVMLMSARPRKLNEEEIRAAVESLEGWKVVGGKLHREYKFASFVEAFGFMA